MEHTSPGNIISEAVLKSFSSFSFDSLSILRLIHCSGTCSGFSSFLARWKQKYDSQENHGENQWWTIYWYQHKAGLLYQLLAAHNAKHFFLLLIKFNPGKLFFSMLVKIFAFHFFILFHFLIVRMFLFAAGVRFSFTTDFPQVKQISQHLVHWQWKRSMWSDLFRTFFRWVMWQWKFQSIFLQHLL